MLDISDSEASITGDEMVGRIVSAKTVNGKLSYSKECFQNNDTFYMSISFLDDLGYLFT